MNLPIFLVNDKLTSIMNARLIFTLSLLILLGYTTSALLLPLFMGALFAIVLSPLQSRLLTKRWKPVPAALAVTLGLGLIGIAPTAFLIYFVAKSSLGLLKSWGIGNSNGAESAADKAMDFTDNLKTWFDGFMQSSHLKPWLDRLGEWSPEGSAQFMNAITDVARGLGARFTGMLGGFFTELPFLTMSVIIIILSCYFFLVDGQSLVNQLKRLSFFNEERTNRLFNSFEGLCRSVILASLLSGLTQAFVYTMALVIAQVQNAALIGFLIFLASFIPVIGSAPISFGVAFFTLFTYSKGAGIGLLIAAAIIAVLDNIVRPMVLKGGSRLHPLLAFIAAFGGLQSFGFAGIFIGPIIAGLFITAVELTLEK